MSYRHRILMLTLLIASPITHAEWLNGFEYQLNDNADTLLLTGVDYTENWRYSSRISVSNSNTDNACKTLLAGLDNNVNTTCKTQGFQLEFTATDDTAAHAYCHYRIQKIYQHNTLQSISLLLQDHQCNMQTGYGCIIVCEPTATTITDIHTAAQRIDVYIDAND